MRGAKREAINSYIQEYLWRVWFLPKRASPTDVIRTLVLSIVNTNIF